MGEDEAQCVRLWRISTKRTREALLQFGHWCSVGTQGKDLFLDFLFSLYPSDPARAISYRLVHLTFVRREYSRQKSLTLVFFSSLTLSPFLLRSSPLTTDVTALSFWLISSPHLHFLGVEANSELFSEALSVSLKRFFFCPPWVRLPSASSLQNIFL